MKLVREEKRINRVWHTDKRRDLHLSSKAVLTGEVRFFLFGNEFILTLVQI